MFEEFITRYFEYSPVKAIYDKIVIDVVQLRQYHVIREGFTGNGICDKLNCANPALASELLVVFVLCLIVGLILFVLNIMGIVKAFGCQHIAVAVLSIIGMFFGIPIGTIYYIVYLCNPSICK